VVFIKDFGDTAALMLTVASPRASAVQIKLHARGIRQAIEQTRSALPKGGAPRVSIVACYPKTIPVDAASRTAALFASWVRTNGLVNDVVPLSGAGFVGVDMGTSASDAQIRSAIEKFFMDQVPGAELHPDTWQPALVRDPAKTEEVLSAVAGDKY